MTHESDIKKLYLEVNKAEVVKEIDLPDTLAPDLKSHIDGACELLARDFPEMHKPSERCRPPHVHRDTLRNKLFLSPAIHRVSTAEHLYELITKVNGKLSAKPAGFWPERVRAKPLQKAKQHGLFLGLNDCAWIEMLGQP